MTQISGSKTITIGGVWSVWVELYGEFNFALSGSFSATVTVQKRYQDTGDVFKVDTFNGSDTGSHIGNEPEENVDYRFGVDEGDYSSGRIIGRLSQ